MVISWQENLPSEEMPPRDMWLDNEELGKWFKAVRRKREAQISGEPSEDIEGSVEHNAMMEELFGDTTTLR